jgi:hypothetical protein
MSEVLYIAGMRARSWMDFGYSSVCRHVSLIASQILTVRV